MVYVRLAQSWTDDGGAAHAAGDMVNIDAITLAKLEANGVVSDRAGADGVETLSWPGPTGPRPDGDDGVHTAAWPGPTGPRPEGDDGVRLAAWPGPTGPRPDGGDGDEQWPGPTGPDPDPTPQWPGPTTPDPRL
jgi:hypothetical protein